MAGIPLLAAGTDTSTTVTSVDDDAIRTLLNRLARTHPSGGTVIERAAIVAEGGRSDQVLSWMLAHGAEPEAPVAKTVRHGVHELDRRDGATAAPTTPARYIMPPGALD